jgi:putative ABC transport system permease protein
MKLQDFRVGARLLAKEPAYSLVAILGLGVGLAVCLLLLGYARYSWQYNSHVPGIDNVYVVKHRDNVSLGAPWFDVAPMYLREAAKTVPGVVGSTGYVGWFRLTLQVNGELRRLKSLTVLPGFGEMVGLQAIRGSLDEALSRPDSLAITEDAAIRFFGTSDVLGRTVTLYLDAIDRNTATVRIAAVLRTPPANSTISFETLNGVNVGVVPEFMRPEVLGGPGGWRGNLLVRLQPGASVAAVTEALQKSVDKAPSTQRIPPAVKERLGSRRPIEIQLSPLRAAYFDKDLEVDFAQAAVDRGDPAVVSGLVAIAFLILLLAAINYVNLATIRVIRRQREIAMRKVLGTKSSRLVQLFVAESMLVSLAATTIGLLLAALALPAFSGLMNRDLSDVLSPGNIGAALAIGILLGLLTAIYPASIAFGVRPSLMLTGRPDTESSGSKRLRQGLSVLQVAVAMGLASFTMAIAWQTRFAIDASPGFDPSPLLVFELPIGMEGQSDDTRSLDAALTQSGAVVATALSSDPVGHDLRSTEIRRDGGEGVTMTLRSASTRFFEVYGIRPVAGRLFDSKIDRDGDRVPVVINALAARQLGFASPELAVGETLLFRGPGQQGALQTRRIVGIAPETRFYSLRESPGPVAYELFGGTVVTVRAAGSLADAERAVRSAWPRYFPNSVVEIRPAKELFAASYADDARLAKLLAIATVVAMVIAAFGAYVLAADAVQRRTREITLRKLFGAQPRDIGKLVAKEIGTAVLVAAAFAVPIAALAIARYLAPYSEQTPFAFWTLALALGAAAATAALALRPAAALRS